LPLLPLVPLRLSFFLYGIFLSYRLTFKNYRLIIMESVDGEPHKQQFSYDFFHELVIRGEIVAR